MERGELLRYTDISELQRRMEGMDDAEQRRFMRRLSMETHVTLHEHIADESKYKKKVEEMHAALFHPTNGLVNLRKWLCATVRWTGGALIGTVAIAASVATFGHNVGWW